MSSVKSAGSGPRLNPQLQAALDEPLAKLRRGEPGIGIADLKKVLDQFAGHDAEQLRIARQLIIDADPSAVKLFAGKKDDPTRGVATPERLARLLAGEAHGSKPLPTNVAEASKQLAGANEALWQAESAATAAQQQLATLGNSAVALPVRHQESFEALFTYGRRKSERDGLADVTQAFANQRPGGPVVFSPRVFELLLQPLGEGRPTLGDLTVALIDGKPELHLQDVPVLVDRLLDLNPIELKQLRKALAPTRDLDARYQALGKNNPLEGITTPKKLVEMLGGIGYGKPALPTTLEAAKEGAAALRQQAASAPTLQEKHTLDAAASSLEAVGEKLGGIKRLSGAQQRSWMVAVSARSGIPGVLSFGFEKMVGKAATDRQTGERKWQTANQVFLRTPATINSYTWSKQLKGKVEAGVNLPYVYGSVGNPLFGSRAGVFIPLVMSSFMSANGSVGLGIVVPTPIPLLHLGISAYVTDPRLIRIVEPALEAVERVKEKLKPLTAPIADAWANLRHPVKVPEDAVSVEWKGSAPAQELQAGEPLTVTGNTHVKLAGQNIDLALAPGTTPVNVQLGRDGEALTLLLDGKTHELPVAKGKTRVVISEQALFVQLGEGSAARGLQAGR